MDTTTVNYEHKRIKVLLIENKEASKRSRTVLLFLTVACSIIVCALFNFYYSWMRHVNDSERGDFALTHKFVCSPMSANDSINIRSTMSKIYAEQFFLRNEFNIPILGIKCSVQDLDVIAPFFLLIILGWYFFSVRREHHILLAIYFIVKEKYDKYRSSESGENNTDENSKAFFEYIYYSVVNNKIFESAKYNDIVISAGASSLGKGIEIKNFKRNSFYRLLIYLMTLGPLLTLVLILYIQISSMLDVADVYPNIIKNILELLIRDMALLIAVVTCFFQSYNILKLRNQIKEILKYFDEIYTELNPSRFVIE